MQQATIVALVTVAIAGAANLAMNVAHAQKFP